MSRLYLYLLGSPRIECDGAPIKIDRRKATALLAYLAVTQKPQSRETLAALLWPDYTSSRASAYVRNALWTLNQTPVSTWLDIDYDTVRLRRNDNVWLDVDRFRERLAACQTLERSNAEVLSECVPLLAEAIDLYTGDFLAGFSLGDNAAFDEWQRFEMESLRRELEGALEMLVCALEAHGDFEAAITYGRRWLAQDPLRESAHRHLMQGYARAGQRSAALRQYDECVRLLKAELHTAPEEETTSLYQAIRAGPIGEETAQRRPGIIVTGAARGELSSIPHNLPAATTPFVGRDVELNEIHRLLAEPACRMLTLVGLGGNGKTRLALQTAREVVEAQDRAFPQGVFFVPLAPVSTVDFIIPAIADALRVPSAQGYAEPQQDSAQSSQIHAQLRNYLREKRLLLVLDNVEHLLDGIDVVAELLLAAPGVKLLLTSRERLNLSSEWVLDIAGLQFPAEVTLSEISAENAPMPPPLETYSAVQLFLQSAQRAAVGFSPDDDDLDAIVRICQLVEGVPLGIELAASWVKVLTCQEIVTEITTNLDFLTTSLRDLPARHRSLRAVFAQSWALLSGDGRACFRKLAVFRGGFTREAAEAVANASLGALASLLDKSLLRRIPDGRYEMHELLRQYADERLAGVPRESDVVRDRHCEHYLGLVQSLEMSLKGAEQKLAITTIQHEMENVRMAWRWACEHGRLEDLRRAAMGMFLFYDMRSRYQAGRDMFRAATRAAEAHLAPRADAALDLDTCTMLAGFLLTIQGWFHHFSSQSSGTEMIAGGQAYLDSLAGEITRRREIAFARVLAAFAGMVPDRERVESYLLDCLAVFEARDDRWGVGVTLDALSTWVSHQDDALAERYALQSLDTRRSTGDRWGYRDVAPHVGLDRREARQTGRGTAGLPGKRRGPARPR